MRCQSCGEDVDEIERRKQGRKTLKLCEDCAGEFDEQGEIAAEAESAMQGMMEYKGR